MGTRKILEIGDPVLRSAARRVAPDALGSAKMQALIDDLIDTMRDAQGAGLAASQVGELVRICVIEVDQNARYPYKPKIPLTVLVNPELTPVGNAMFDNYEGCLSVPNLRGRVPRHAELELTALDRDGVAITQTVRGITAGTFQHEVDHLDGTLFVDRVRDTHSLCTWEAFKAHHEAAFVETVRGVVEQYGS